MTTPNTKSMTNSTVPPTPLHPRIAEIVAFLNAEREQLVTYVNTLSDSVSQHRPAPAQWSVADTLEHLALLEDSVGRLVSTLIKQARTEGDVQDVEMSSIMGTLDQYNVEGTETKLVAPERVRPSGAASVSASLQRLTDSREHLLNAVRSASGLDLTRVSAPHPFFGPINAYQWLVLIGRHELRHLKQMKNSAADFLRAHDSSEKQ
jgi:hypothetical protein